MLLMMLVMNERIKEVVFDFIKQANKVIVLRDKVAQGYKQLDSDIK